MNRSKWIWRVAALALVLGPAAAWLGPGAAAQGSGTVIGEVRDRAGNPFPEVVLIFKNTEMGQTYTMKSDKNGKFVQAGVRTGSYDIDVKVKDQVVFQTNCRVTTGEETKVDINFKELVEKQGAAKVEEARKQEEQKSKFETMKTHFDGGVAALEQAKTVRTEMQRTPADQRAPLQQKLGDLYGTAVTEFEGAQKSAAENDPNMHIVMAKLGESYEAAGRYDDAVSAYKKATELKPDQAGYYNNLGNALAKAGKIDEAGVAYQKSATLDPANAAGSWRNFGIVLFNASKPKEAIEPLKKSIEIDPKSAQSWYLLGASLVSTMGTRVEGDKVIPILQPGTVEAYEKCIELDANGPYGKQCTDGLEQLKLMGVGIQTKIRTRTKKP
jgi:tetratricopeptide (TPR) repeat protein